jgi:hypothetical protein
MKQSMANQVMTDEAALAAVNHMAPTGSVLATGQKARHGEGG